MRIGVMLRTIDEDQGIGIYTRNLVPRLLRLDPNNDYLLIYRSPERLHRFAEFKNATGVLLRVPTKPLWDQMGVPWAARKYGLDLLFNTKFTVPLFTGCRTVMTLHGSDWFTHPDHYPRLDRAYVRRFVPRYCRKADHLIANSELTKRDFVRLLGVPAEKITTIHFAANERFRPVTDPDELARVRQKYRLPKRFILSVTKYSRQKNVHTLIEAYQRLPSKLRGALVLVGHGVGRYLEELNLRGTRWERELITPGWVAQEDLPAIYSQAELFAFPSRYEAFGIPIVEAMSCGCPVVASNAGAIPEISGGAAELVDPDDVEALAAALEVVLCDGSVRDGLMTRGLTRAGDFSWETHAQRTIEVFRRCMDL